jgi:Ca2+-binding RTX toxin-like protein
MHSKENDTLTGGAGSDRFVFDTTNSSLGVDTLKDFVHEIDRIVLDKSTFTVLTSSVGNGFSNSTDFALVANDAAVGTSKAFIVYSSNTGNLFYNPDGETAGLAAGGQFATLSGHPSLAASDFMIQA